MFIPIDSVLPNPEQPRRTFDPVELEELAASIRLYGVIQPIVVERAGDGFILHDGERRLRAAKLAGLLTIPVVVAEAPVEKGEQGRERFMRALVANLQRADLTPVEEGRAYARMRDEFGLSVAQICRQVGKSRARVEQRLLLLELDEPIQELIAEKRLHQDARLADALLLIPDKEARIKTARGLANRGASLKAAVQAAEKVREMLGPRDGTFIDGTPALELGARRIGSPRLPLPEWDMLRQAGKVPPWELVAEAARRTCDGCGLREIASAEACRQCPAAEMLGLMLAEARKAPR